MTAPIPVVYCYDDNYLNYAAVSTFSLKRNSKSALDISWLVKTADRNTVLAAKTALNNLGIEISIIFIEHDKFSNWKTTGHINASSYLRLEIPEIIRAEKAIYLDADTIVLNDLAELYATEMNETPFAGVVDPVGAKSSKVPRSKNDQYINSGVLLMNLKILLNDNFMGKCEELYNTYNRRLTWQDQCIINKYSENNKILLDSKWNFQIFANMTSSADFNKVIDERRASIIHFLGDKKPWSLRGNDTIGVFWRSYADAVGIQIDNPANRSMLSRLLRLYR